MGTSETRGKDYLSDVNKSIIICVCFFMFQIFPPHIVGLIKLIKLQKKVSKVHSTKFSLIFRSRKKSIFETPVAAAKFTAFFVATFVFVVFEKKSCCPPGTKEKAGQHRRRLGPATGSLDHFCCSPPSSRYAIPVMPSSASTAWCSSLLPPHQRSPKKSRCVRPAVSQSPGSISQ